VDRPLARQNSSVEKVADYARTIQPRPLDQVHQFFHLIGVLWLFYPAGPLLWNVANVAERGTPWLFPNIEPPPIPFSKGCALGAAEIVVLHLVTQIEVYSTCNLGASNCSLLSQAKQVPEQIKVQFNPHKNLAKVNESCHHKLSLGADCKSQSHSREAGREEMDAPAPQNPS